VDFKTLVDGGLNGVVVRSLCCHAYGRGFESPNHGEGQLFKLQFDQRKLL
jgi:hypothetical protein